MTHPRRAFDFLTSGLFVAAIAAPVLAMVARADRPEVTTENRTLAAMPPWPVDGDTLRAYPEAFEKYFNDCFGFRGRLNRLHQVAWFDLFGISPHEEIVVGKGGTLFNREEVDDYRQERPLTEAQLAVKARTMQERHDWLAAQGIRYLVVLVPTKASIYPELLPGAVRPLHPRGTAEQFEDYLRKHTTVEVLNLKPALRTASRERRTYYDTDTHWNCYGAYVAYREIVGRLAGWFPGMTPIPLEECAIEEKPVVGDLAMIMGFPDRVELSDSILPSHPHARSDESWQPNREFPHRYLSTTGDPRRPNAVVMHDSFMTVQHPFLAEHFNTAYFSWVWGWFDSDAVAVHRPHVVIHQFVERTIPGDRFDANQAVLKSPPSGLRPVPPLASAGPEPTERPKTSPTRS